MAMPVELSLGKSAHKKHRVRPSLFVILALLSVFSSTIFASSAESSLPEAKANLATKAVALKTGVYDNPAITTGPKCTRRVILLIDRSHSVKRYRATDGQTGEVHLKNSIINFINQYGLQGELGTYDTEIAVAAFARFAVDQQPGLVTASISDPNNRVLTALNAGLIHFRLAGEPRSRSSLPEDVIRGYPSTDRGDTNYEAAFRWSEGKIDEINNSTPGTGPDDDVDMVIMVTDGVPTASEFSSPLYNGHDTIDTNQGGDSLRAIYAAASLRQGTSIALGGTTQVRQPVSVRGIFINTDGSDPDLMNLVFGAGNWSGANDFGQALQTALLDAVQTMGPCAIKQPIDGNMSISVNPSNTAIPEGGNQSISITINNTGSTTLTGVRLYLNGAPPATPWSSSCGTSTTITPGNSATCTTTSPTIQLGAPAPSGPMVWTVVANDSFDTNTYYLRNATPQRSATTSYTIIRKPLPT